MNALKHGERSAMMLATRRDLNRTLREMQLQEEANHERIDGLPEVSPPGTWARLIANQVRLSTELMLSFHESTR